MLVLFQHVITFMINNIGAKILPECLIFAKKKLTEQYKSLSKVIVSFIHIYWYNVYVPLLFRMADNVEENLHDIPTHNFVD